MTSNIGSQKILDMSKVQAGVLEMANTVKEELEKSMKPELLNRIDEIVVFSPLSYKNLRAIASNILDETIPDKYAFVRDAWMLRREFLIYDGNPPEDFSEEELFDDEGLFEDDELLKDELTDDELLHEEGMESQVEIMTIETAPATEPEGNQ